MINQNPEQIARDHIDKLLTSCGWIVQRKTTINLNAGLGVAVCEYQTEVGPADYVLFVEGKPVGIIEANKTYWSCLIYLKILYCSNKSTN